MNKESILFKFNYAIENHYPYLGIAFQTSKKENYPEIMISINPNFKSFKNYILNNYNKFNIIDINYDYDVTNLITKIYEKHNFNNNATNIFKEKKEKIYNDYSYQFFTDQQIKEILSSLSDKELKKLGYTIIKNGDNK